MIWRYNTVINCESDGIFFEFGGAQNFQFYGNVFYNTPNSLITLKNGGQTYGPIFIYNNVFEAPSASSYGWVTTNGSPMAAGSKVYNNIFFNVSNDFEQSLSDYNAYNYTRLNGYDWPSNEAHSFTFAGNPFIDLSPYTGNGDPDPGEIGDFHLIGSAQAQFEGGLALAADGFLNKDADGNTRASPWYIGAYQYIGGSPTPTPTPKPTPPPTPTPKPTPTPIPTPTPTPTPTLPKYVQGFYAAPQAAPTTVQVTYAAAQGLGNLNVVIVGWSDTTAQVSSVTDSEGNAYQLAVGPTQLAAALSQSVYYAKNISAAAAGTNTVTVRFASAAHYPDIRILEYSGIDPLSPVDVVVSSTGNSATTSSGYITTKNASDLLLAADTVQTETAGAGGGFTQRLLTGLDGDIAEDRVVTATGAYSAAAPLSSPGEWIMQMVAFKVAGANSLPTPTPTPAPTPTPTPPSVSLAWNANAPTTDPGTNTVGYRLHVGPASGNYNRTIDVGNSTTATISDLISGSSYYFVAGAYNAAGVEGSYSNEASYSAP